jgi:N-acetylmuramoyl-L-alanine amidase
MYLFLILILSISTCFAGTPSFKGKISEDGVNIRTDATVASQVVSTLAKDSQVDVVGESYGWYKIKLPVTAPAYIRNDMAHLFVPQDNKRLKVDKEGVNVRLRPNDASPIIGRLDKDQEAILIEERSGWYRIEPPEGSYGWVSEYFVIKEESSSQE